MLCILRLPTMRALICVPLAPSLHKLANATHASHVFCYKNSPSPFNTPHGMPDGLPIKKVCCRGRAIIFALPVLITILIMNKGVDMSLNSGGCDETLDLLGSDPNNERVKGRSNYVYLLCFW